MVAHGPIGFKSLAISFSTFENYRRWITLENRAFDANKEWGDTLYPDPLL